ncbi:type II toxin-antitoxin system RelB/DinJ family antitoxin [Candidatus Kaiserbacteria bacterium]|nr:type II toxin-antitoxin system RelB/DinJ family antitoxin [Candidatus Kaiserbacteria bacterium]
MSTSTINIRIDEKTKRRAAATLSSIGLDMSSAVKMFLHQVILEDGVPFIPSRKRQKEIRAEWDQEIAEAMKGTSYRTAKELHDAIE